LSESTSCSATGPRPRMPMIPHMREIPPYNRFAKARGFLNENLTGHDTQYLLRIATGFNPKR
jgi:hypothetical protein